MKTELGGIPPCCLLTFQGKKSTVDSWSGCECSVSSAAHSRRVLLRVCSLFSCSPAVDQPLLTFQRSHGILTVAGSEGASASAGLCYGQHGPPLAAFTPRLSKKCLINGSVWTHQAHSQRHHFNFVCHATNVPITSSYKTDWQSFCFTFCLLSAFTLFSGQIHDH